MPTKRHENRRHSDHLIGIVGLILLATGSYFGLVAAPAERYMGDVGRILYIHVPTAWVALLTLTTACVLAIGAIITRNPKWDDVHASAVQTGILLTVMLLIQGAIWAKPTWGVYWTWDPRLTTSAIMLLAFSAVLGLRASIENPSRRMIWSAVATIVAFVDVPIVYFSIKWWRTLHQEFSTPKTISPEMILPLRINAFAMLLIAAWLIVRGTRVHCRRREEAAHRISRPILPSALSEPLIAGD